MKKLVLKKDVVARINHNEMNQLRGGYGDSDNACKDTRQQCPTQVVTCYGQQTCPGYQSCDVSCGGPCETCPWLYSCVAGCTEY